MHRPSVASTGLVVALVLTGCSGGGGSSSPGGSSPGGVPVIPPATQPVTTPTATPPGAPADPRATTVSVQSVPAGLGVTITNGSASRSATTPTSTTPIVSNFQTLISITPSNGAPAYSYALDQHGAGSRTFLYNQSADTNGSLGTIATSSSARGFTGSPVAAQTAQSVEAGLPRRFSRGGLNRPRESASRVVVRYRAAALRSLGRAREIETAEGVVRGVDVGPQTGAVVTRVIDVPSGRSIGEFAASLRARAEVASAAPERLYYTQSKTAVTPSDTHFDNLQQWSLFAINAPNAWGYTHGAGPAIAVIDTGADFNHADLTGPKITFAESIINGVKTSGNAAAQDTDGHGTNVAGIAAADTNNGFGYAGVGFDASLQIYKVFPDSTAANKYAASANSGDVTQAIYEAVSHGARVINLSLGSCQGAGADPMQRDAVAYALANNVTVVAAAGNERGGGVSDPSCSNGSSTVDFPAAYDGVIAVGASKLDDSRSPGVPSPANTEAVASYSNSGPGLTLVAPGGDPTAADMSASSPTDLLHWIAGLYSTTAADPAAQCRNKADCRALFAGTSQAAPHVSGAVALMLAANPALGTSQVKTILSATADDIGDPNEGAGRLDAYRALAAVTGDSAQPAVPTNANFVAFAYLPNGTNVPQILDVTFTTGVRVAGNGTFRIADIPAGTAAYKIGVWYDANGDGKVDAGDYFGSSQACVVTAPCTTATGIVVHPVGAVPVLL